MLNVVVTLVGALIVNDCGPVPQVSLLALTSGPLLLLLPLELLALLLPVRLLPELGVGAAIATGAVACDTNG